MGLRGGLVLVMMSHVLQELGSPMPPEIESVLGAARIAHERERIMRGVARVLGLRLSPRLIMLTREGFEAWCRDEVPAWWRESWKKDRED